MERRARESEQQLGRLQGRVRQIERALTLAGIDVPSTEIPESEMDTFQAVHYHAKNAILALRAARDRMGYLDSFLGANSDKGAKVIFKAFLKTLHKSDYDLVVAFEEVLKNYQVRR